jgi:hypothetical protein
VGGDSHDEEALRSWLRPIEDWLSVLVLIGVKDAKPAGSSEWDVVKVGHECFEATASHRGSCSHQGVGAAMAGFSELIVPLLLVRWSVGQRIGRLSVF